MRITATVLKYPLIAVVFVLGFTLWAIRDRYNYRATWDSLKHATADATWFPDMKTRIHFGSPDVWRPEGGFNATDSQSEVLDPIADRTFYMLKTGADVMWDRVPVHLETTFKRFPHHQIYADTSSVVGGESVVDVIGMIPEAIISSWLPGYRVRRQQVEESWGWDSRQIQQQKTEGWDTDKFKNVPMMLHAFKNAPRHCDWFIFADDDTFIHSQSLGSLLRGLNPRDQHYIGSSALIGGAIADMGETGERLKAERPNPDEGGFLWFAHGGSGVIVSRGAVEALFWDPQREQDLIRTYSEAATATCCGDAVFAYMLREELGLYLNKKIDSSELSIDPFQGEILATMEISISASGLCSRLGTWHHLAPWEVQKLYDWERSLVHRKSNTEAGVLYSDMYHDLVLPYITPYREQWDNGAKSSVYGWDNSVTIEGENDEEKLLYPYSSLDACTQACNHFPRCLGWKYEFLEPNNTCTLEFDHLRRGISRFSVDEGADSENKVISGWNVDRIREIRSGEVCDSLEYDEASESYNDSEDESEGWYFKKLDSEQQGATKKSESQ